MRHTLTGLMMVLAFALLAVGTASASFTLDLATNRVQYDGAVIYQETHFRSAGTGVIDPFLTIKDSNDPDVWGYNNDAAHHESDDVKEAKTHSLTLANVPLVTIGTTGYREFLLDDNQQGGNSIINLTQLEIYTVAGNPNINALDGAAGLRALGALTYSLDKPADGSPANDGTVVIDATPPGGGKADMFLYVPDDYFNVFGAADGSGTNVYLFSEFGLNNDGFEEWAVLLNRVNPDLPPPPTAQAAPVAEPASILLLGAGLFGRSARRKRS